MDLYFSPLACSMATRIALAEAAAEATFIEVDPRTKRLPDGTDFRAVNPLGLVPVLRTDAGELLFENAAILQYVADRFPAAGLAPADPWQRARLQQWLNFIASEVHRGLFTILLDPKAPAAAKEHAIAKGESRLAYLDAHLAGREFLLDRFTVADAYLCVVLGWSRATSLDLGKWPNLKAYASRLRKRASIARALAVENPLYLAEQARHAAA
ncbi:MAG: glutathione S-transferase N-terminal domain-containing protein [Xanthobacteraceae bacterium]|nr:glutathione S-transferase N-terminal domain-containing protein [Xanthobacteraceae bacterium]